MDIRKPSYEESCEQVSDMVDHFVAETKIPGMDPEDVRQELCIKVWHIWKCFDPSRGVEFSTCVYKGLCNRKNELFRAASAQKRGSGLEPLSIDELHQRDEGDSVGSLENLLPAATDPLDEMTALHDILCHIREVISKAHPSTRAIYQDMLAGYKQVEIAARNNCGQPLVSYHIAAFRQKVYDILVCNGYTLPKTWKPSAKKMTIKTSKKAVPVGQR